MPAMQAGTAYRIDLEVLEPWMDDAIPADPEGFGPERMRFGIGWLALPLRRSVEGSWFQPFITIRPDGGGPGRSYPLEFHPEGSRYIAVFKPAVSGAAVLWVNDTAIDLSGLTRRYYDNNRGTAKVTVTPLAKPGQ
jgi:hypothetical protein